MTGLALSGGTLLPALQGKKLYQPIWQFIGARNSPNGTSSCQHLVSDGRYLTYNVVLNPTCTISYDKSQWKNKNYGKQVGEVIAAYKYPYLKIVDFHLTRGDKTTVLFLTKVKLMGWEKNGKDPDILRLGEVDVIMFPRGHDPQIIRKSREGLLEFENVPVIELCDQSENSLDMNQINSLSDKKQEKTLMELVTAESVKQDLARKITERDLIFGDLAPLGPNGLNLLALCRKCNSITYSTDNEITKFKPPVKTLMENLYDILPGQQKFEFCSCDDENEQFRKEFQNKCMVVNQDTSSGPDRKVQCILVSKEQHSHQEQEEEDEFKKLKITNGINGHSQESSDDDGMSKCLVPIINKVARVSSKLRLCENCGIQERDMTACKHCSKVWYCNALCKKADLKAHTAVCRAYITARRYLEERAAFAKKIHEPDDGCGTCGFWRESLELCNKCNKVSYCSYRCKDIASERHKPVCEAFTVIQNYRKKYIIARTQEVD